MSLAAPSESRLLQQHALLLTLRACSVQGRHVSLLVIQFLRTLFAMLKGKLLYMRPESLVVASKQGTKKAGGYLDELQAESSQGQLSERGESQNGRVNGVADRVIEAGDLQALQAAHQGERAQIPSHDRI